VASVRGSAEDQPWTIHRGRFGEQYFVAVPLVAPLRDRVEILIARRELKCLQALKAL
jgi:hypothetical protein